MLFPFGFICHHIPCESETSDEVLENGQVEADQQQVGQLHQDVQERDEFLPGREIRVIYGWEYAYSRRQTKV